MDITNAHDIMKQAGKTAHTHKDLRPTSNKVREALFDILRGRIENIRFLDLYAGTGAVGLDALKEGAAEVTFVEGNKKYAQNISDLLRKRGIAERAKVVNKKVLTFIEWAELEGMVFDIIFIDPPYHSEEITHALKAIELSRILGHEGTVIAEHFSKKELPEQIGALKKAKDYHYGDSVLSFYKVKTHDQSELHTM